jgi:hypothetical protein
MIAPGKLFLLEFQLVGDNLNLIVIVGDLMYQGFDEAAQLGLIHSISLILVRHGGIICRS